MFDSLAGHLRGGIPDRLAEMLDSDPRDTRRAMEVSLPALIGGLRDKTREPGGADELVELFESDAMVAPDEISDFIASGDARVGAGILDGVFGERGEGALTSLSKASGLGTRLLARVMSMLAPVATGWLAHKAGEEDMSSDEVADYLQSEVDDLDDKGYGKVLALLGGGTMAAGAVAGATSVVRSATGVPATLSTPSASVDTDLDPNIDADLDGAVDGPDVDLDLDGLDADGLDADVSDADVKVSLDGPDADVDLDDGWGPEIDLAREQRDRDAQDASDLPDIENLKAKVKDEKVPTGGQGAGGWIWWAIAALAFLALLALIIRSCNQDDSTATTTPAPTETTADTDTGTDTGATDATTDTAAPADDAQQPQPPVVDQAQLDQALAVYGVTGRVENNAIVLEGQVENEAARTAALDAAISVANGVPVQDNIQVVEPFTIASIVETNLGNFSSLDILLDEAGLTDALRGSGPFTVFAPVDFAFDAMTDLGELRADPARLSQFLQYHVVPGRFDAAQLRGLDVLPTLVDGQSIKVTTDADGNIMLNDVVSVAQVDAQADNGLLHTVTGVLRPATEGGITAPSELSEALALDPISFELGSATIADSSEADLDKVVDYLLENPQPIEIAGHTDGDGPEDFNQELSEERADSVRQYLINNGIPADSVTAVGYGESQPIAPNDTDENKAKNRRIEFNLGG